MSDHIVECSYCGSEYSDHEMKRLEGDYICQTCFEYATAAEEDNLCPYCNGSGEGMHERTICHRCLGRGVLENEA
jgi:DnaJ-class molecular chaperone